MDQNASTPGGAGQDRQVTVSRSVTIVNRRGLHARAAAKFAKLAERFLAEVTVNRNDMSVPGRSIMGLMMLAAARDCEIEIVAVGLDAGEALEALAALVADKFEEDD